MNTVGWIFILLALLVGRSVMKGRVMNIGEDTSDAFLALVTGDQKGLTEVLSRQGESTEVSLGTVQIREVVKTADGIKDSATSIAKQSIRLGEAAKGYKWTAVGPDYYDCSGLIWRACKAVGYKKGRFTTSTIRNDRENFKVISPPGTQGPGVTAAGYDDLVLWPEGSGGLTGHIGVITGSDLFYSARSVKSGISEAKISTFRKTRPIYIRYVGPRQATEAF